MFSFIGKHIRTLTLIFTAFLSVALLLVGIMMMSEYTANLEDQAGTRSLLYASDAANNIKETINNYMNLSKNMAEYVTASAPADNDGFIAVINSLFRIDRFSQLYFCRYYKDGVDYTRYGEVFDMTLEDPAVRNHIADREAICTGVVTDRDISLAVVGFVIPLDNFEYADNIIFFFPPEIVVQAQPGLNQEYLESSRLTAVCSNSGEILNILHEHENEDGTSDYHLHQNIYEAIEKEVNSKSIIDQTRETIRTGSAATFPVIINGEQHVIAVSSIGKTDASFSIVSIYESQQISSGGYATISIILGMLVIFLILLFVVAIMSIATYARSRRKIAEISGTDERIKCNTRVRFEKEAHDLTQQFAGSNYAIIVVCIKHYMYFNDQVGYDSVTDILCYIRDLIKNQLDDYETFGYLTNGLFAICMHYKDLSVIRTRLVTITTLAERYKEHMPEGYHLELYGGIYELSRGYSSNINEMVDFAMDASEASAATDDIGTFHMYSEDFNEKKRITGYIEVHQEAALAGNEFKVFYQPKYNIGNNRPDGSEALVRWYDENKDQYALPGVFMPLFESNGFITKLDRYVYEEVCRYISDSLAARERVYPVSVNVSRLTAAEPDFVDFYIETKRKYNIPAGYIMIEFTESIAYENYEVLRDIINRLHQNGFKCSIDDFGSGYSSYSILKELQMDEIKLDRFFIKPGQYADRDEKVLTSIIKLGKDLNMKITQEGVETKEQLLYLKKLGCEVIQGFYYARPMGKADFVSFLTSKKIALDFDNN